MIFRLGYRNLFRNRRRTLITVMSVAGGMMFSMLFTGLQDGSYKKLINLAARTGSGHLTFENKLYREDPDIKNSLQDYQAIAALLANDSAIDGFSPRVRANGMVASPYGSAGVFFDAVDAAIESKTSPLVKELVRGKYLRPGAYRDILIGDNLARKLKVDLDDKLVLTANNRHNETVQELLRVIGIFHVGSDLLDGFYLQLPIGITRNFLGLSADEVSQVAVFLPSYREIPQVKKRLQKLIEDKPDIHLATWQEVMQDLANYIAMDRAFNIILQIFAFLIIAAGVLNTVLMSVLERRFEFGMMLAMGTPPKKLFALIVTETSLIGIVSVFLGSILGWSVNALFARYPLDLTLFTKEDISISGFAFEPVLRTGLFWQHYLVTMGLIYLLVVIVGLYPAWRAARFVPVEALRGR